MVDLISQVSESVLDAEQERLRTEAARLSFLAGKFPEFLQAEYSRASAAYTQFVQKRSANVERQGDDKAGEGDRSGPGVATG